VSVEGERFIKPKEIVAKAHGLGAKVSVVALRKHGEGLVVQYTVRYEGIAGKAYHVGIINSRGNFAGSLLIQ